MVLWEASDRLCSKRLKPLIPVLLPALALHGQLDVDGELRDKLLTISAATMDRLLSQVRVVARGGQRRRAGMSSAVRRSVPIRTFGDWNDPPPGYVEVDSWPTPAPPRPVALRRRWFLPISLRAGPEACRCGPGKAVL